MHCETGFRPKAKERNIYTSIKKHLNARDKQMNVHEHERVRIRSSIFIVAPIPFGNRLSAYIS